MSQPSKPTGYLKAAAKALRLQRASSRPKGSTAKEPSSTAGSSISSAPCTPTRSSFQHSNGRRLSFNPCQYQHSFHSHHYRPECYDSPVLTLQRRRNNSTQNLMSIGLSALSLASAKSSSASSIAASSKHGRRSGAPALFPIVTIHHLQSGSSTCLSRSKSMPSSSRRRKRASHQSIATLQQKETPAKSTWPDDNDAESGMHFSAEHGTSYMGSLGAVGPSSTPPTPAPGTGTQHKAETYSKPSRSHTHSSLNSSRSYGSIFSTTMPLTESNMSIQSHHSETSLLSAVITASGLPSMDVMMDHVDRRVAADCQAQLVENAHVGLVSDQISVVDQDLIIEPCSARVEMWVN
ncbi:hypothetical protein KVV02_004981 [Mortierella alpina]|uniref:Uncharacterized protein n=1 Tax=Mortierella alpina TaxID=64518 RepID=A0A9P8A129_MORAP|nr:hypothetical protein KVV02_004981 [Mortierella alpina]